MYTIVKGRMGKLTAPQLEMAAADLRNARLVVKHAGHFRHMMIGKTSGAVCALAAIQLATGHKRLAYIEPAKTYLALPMKRDAANFDEFDARLYRLENATLAFGDMIPDELCDDCIPGDASEQDQRVVHYNDYHCTSGEMLQNMLGLAADKAMDRAASKRSMVGGRLLATV